MWDDTIVSVLFLGTDDTITTAEVLVISYLVDVKHVLCAHLTKNPNLNVGTRRNNN